MLPMLRTRWGRIINISSVAALTGNRGQVNYAAAKGALNSATKALALELASRGVTVNAVAPGIIESGMAEGTFDAATIERLVPMKRAGTRRRGGGAGGVPRVGRRRLHHRPGDLDQRRDGVGRGPRAMESNEGRACASCERFADDVRMVFGDAHKCLSGVLARPLGRAPFEIRSADRNSASPKKTG